MGSGCSFTPNSQALAAVKLRLQPQQDNQGAKCNSTIRGTEEVDYTLIKNVVNRALEQMAAREMASGGQLSAEQKIAEQVVSDLFPTLAEKFGQMLLINERWTANAVGDKIAKAAMDGQRLAGYEPAAWMVWGQLLPRVMAFLVQPFEVVLPDGTVMQTTLKNAVMTDYVKTEGES